MFFFFFSLTKENRCIGKRNTFGLEDVAAIQHNLRVCGQGGGRVDAQADVLLLFHVLVVHVDVLVLVWVVGGKMPLPAGLEGGVRMVAKVRHEAGDACDVLIGHGEELDDRRGLSSQEY